MESWHVLTKWEDKGLCRLFEFLPLEKEDKRCRKNVGHVMGLEGVHNATALESNPRMAPFVHIVQRMLITQMTRVAVSVLYVRVKAKHNRT